MATERPRLDQTAGEPLKHTRRRVEPPPPAAHTGRLRRGRRRRHPLPPTRKVRKKGGFYARLTVCGGVGTSEGEEWSDVGNCSSAELALAAARRPATSRGAFKAQEPIVLDRALRARLN